MTPPPAASRSLPAKARVRNTWRLLAVPFLAAVLVTGPVWPTGGLVHMGLDLAGYGLLIVCVLGRGWCGAYIGGRKNRELVMTGPFSVVRNPLYVFNFIGAVGVGLSTGIVSFAVVLAILFMLYYGTVVRREEAVLAEKFGASYRDYTQRTPRWIPNFSRWRDSAVLTVNPRFLMLTIRDSAWFFIAPPLLELVEILHRSAVIPTLLRLP